MQHLKNIRYIAIAAYLAALPGSAILQFQSPAPFLYKVIASLAVAVFFALIAIVVGVGVLIAARDKENGGRKVAIIIVVFASLFCSLLTVYPMLRQ